MENNLILESGFKNNLKYRRNRFKSIENNDEVIKY